MSETFRKMCLHHQALYETNNLFHKEPGDVNTFYEKLRSF